VVKLYRHDSTGKKLVLASKGVIDSNGFAKFSGIKQGGEFIAVIV